MDENRNLRKRAAFACNYYLKNMPVTTWKRDSAGNYRIGLSDTLGGLLIQWVLLPVSDVFIRQLDPARRDAVAYDVLLMQSEYSCLCMDKMGNERMVSLSRERFLLLWQPDRIIYDRLFYLPTSSVSQIDEQRDIWSVSWVSSFLRPAATLFVSVPGADLLWQPTSDGLFYRAEYVHVVFSCEELPVYYRSRDTGWHQKKELMAAQDLARDYAYACRAGVLQVRSEEYMNALDALLKE